MKVRRCNSLARRTTAESPTTRPRNCAASSAATVCLCCVALARSPAQRGGLDTMTLVTILCFLGGNVFLTGLQARFSSASCVYAGYWFVVEAPDPYAPHCCHLSLARGSSSCGARRSASSSSPRSSPTPARGGPELTEPCGASLVVVVEPGSISQRGGRSEARARARAQRDAKRPWLGPEPGRACGRAARPKDAQSPTQQRPPLGPAGA